MRNRSARAKKREAGGVEAGSLDGETGAVDEPVVGDADVVKSELRLRDVVDEAVEDAAAVRPAVGPDDGAGVVGDADVVQFERPVVGEAHALDQRGAVRTRRT